MEPVLNKFGGKWTEQKIGIFTKYLRAYLDIMARYDFELIYFDGFAGCGEIEANAGYETLIEGVASKVVELEHKRKFDIYYMVDLDQAKASSLKVKMKAKSPDKNIHVVSGDCNTKLKDLAKFISEKKQKRRALAFIDPFGMQVDWASIASMDGLGVDIWLLVPSGAVNRMLKKDGKISDAWMRKLEKFTGLNESEIIARFYREDESLTLFGTEIVVEKQDKIFKKIIDAYRDQLGTIFKFVSQPLPLRNSKGAILFHFLLGSQNAAALKIANEIIGKEFNT